MLTELARKILQRYPLCDYCLGRLFAGLAKGLGNRARGEALKSLLIMEADLARHVGDNETRIIASVASTHFEPAENLASSLGIEYQAKPCIICHDSLSPQAFDSLASRIAEELREYEFDSFLVGATTPRYVKALEEKIFSEYELSYAEDLKKEVVREVGKRLASLTGKEVKFTNPDMTVLVDIFSGHFELRPSHLFIYGRYLKHSRELPQTPWLCRKCWGRGCSYCDYKGREYEASIAEFVALPAVRLAKALTFKFHAAGREDVDASVEGAGRPFVLELISPRRRTIDLERYREEVLAFSRGVVEVYSLRMASKEQMRILKSSSERGLKRYKAIVVFEDSVPPDKLAEAERALTNRVIDQHTPRRVLKRRADKLRRRRVHEFTARKLDDRTVEFTILADGGLYVKELIHGDDGRTRPSVAEIVGVKPLTITLTVLEVYDKPSIARSHQ